MANHYHEHQELIKRFKILATRELPRMRIFDRTVGLFYAKRVDKGLISYTPIKINRPGMADAYAIHTSVHGMIHLEFEFKTGSAVQNPDQKIWESFIQVMGGFYLLIRDERQAVVDIKKYLKSKGIVWYN